MYKANGRLLDMMSKSKGDSHIELIKQLKKEFSREGKFEPFKYTASYAEIPPITKYEDSGTYIRRKYRGIELVTLGATLYFVECEELKKYLRKSPKFHRLGWSGLRVIRVEDGYFALNEEGMQFYAEMVKKWEKLVQPVFAINICNGK